MTGWQCRQTEQSACCGNVGLLDKLNKFILCTSEFHSVSYECQRFLGRIDEFGGSLNSRLLWSGIRNVTAHEIYLGRFPLCLIYLCVLGEVEHHRTRTSSACDIESTAHSPSDILGTSYLIAPLGYRLSHTHEVNLLEGVGTKHTHAHLSCNHHDRCGVHHGVGNTREGIRCTRTACYDTHSHFVTHPGISLGRMCGSLFVAHENMIKCLLLATCIVVQGIEYWHYRTARISEYCLYALFLEGQHKSFRSGYYLF